jgi:hypothetical protein
VRRVARRMSLTTRSAEALGGQNVWSHLRSFVATMRPKHSLNQNIKSLPLALTGNT